MNLSTAVAVLALPVFLGGFAGFWCFICWIIAQTGGWTALARRFPAGPGLPIGTQYHYMQSLLMGGARYKGCMTIGVAPTGLYLSPVFMFRPGHTPLLIPWNAIARAQTKKLWWQTGYELFVPVDNRTMTTITLFNGSVAAAMGPYLSHLPMSGAMNVAPFR